MLKRHTPQLLALSGVVGVAEGERDGTPCITVFVREQTSTLLAQIPFELEGWPVVVRESGEIWALE